MASKADRFTRTDGMTLGQSLGGTPESMNEFTRLDLYAKIFYRSFTAAQPQALFGQMSAKILQDESRHQAFAIHYLSRNLPRLEPARRAALVRAVAGRDTTS